MPNGPSSQSACLGEGQRRAQHLMGQQPAHVEPLERERRIGEQVVAQGRYRAAGGEPGPAHRVLAHGVNFLHDRELRRVADAGELGRAGDDHAGAGRQVVHLAVEGELVVGKRRCRAGCPVPASRWNMVSLNVARPVSSLSAAIRIGALWPKWLKLRPILYAVTVGPRSDGHGTGERDGDAVQHRLHLVDDENLGSRLRRIGAAAGLEHRGVGHQENPVAGVDLDRLPRRRAPPRH